MKRLKTAKRLLVAASQGECWTFVGVFEDDTSHLRRNKHETRATANLDPKTQHIRVYQDGGGGLITTH